MTRIVVAEDSATQAQSLRQRLEEQGFEVEWQANGRLALEAVRRRPPDLVLTDLDMPEMDGLALVEELRMAFPRVPVVLMTAFGSEETAIAALQRGAASYVPKKHLDRDLLETLDGVLALADSDRDQRRLTEYMTDIECRFSLENDPALVMPVVAHVQEGLSMLEVVDENERLRFGVALEEAIHDCMYRGNLELSPEEIEEQYHLEDGGESYREFFARRRGEPPYRDRRVHVTARISRQEAVCTVRDEGPDGERLAAIETADAARLTGDRGRGLMLVATFMDEVRCDPAAHEITLVKKRGRREMRKDER